MRGGDTLGPALCNISPPVYSFLTPSCWSVFKGAQTLVVLLVVAIVMVVTCTTAFVMVEDTGGAGGVIICGDGGGCGRDGSGGGSDGAGSGSIAWVGVLVRVGGRLMSFD